MPVCCVCKKKDDTNRSFFSIPKDEHRRLKWSQICRMSFSVRNVICSDHFRSADKIKAGRKMLLMPTAEPVVHFIDIDPAEVTPETPTSKYIDEQATKNLSLVSSSQNTNLCGSNYFGIDREQEQKVYIAVNSMVLTKPDKFINHNNDTALESKVFNSVEPEILLPFQLPDENCSITSDPLDNSCIAEETQTEKSCNLFCVLGCPSDLKLYKFPSRGNDKQRRNLWLDFFNMEDPSIEDVYACERHFSRKQSVENGIRFNAVPDKHPKSLTTTHLFKKKAKTDNSEDPAANFNINRNVETLQLHEQSILQIPLVQPVKCTAATQTNSRLCGLVEISDFGDEYRINCFYCCESFPIEKWKKFSSHLKKLHEFEEAFKINKYVSDDHDYTALDLPSKFPIDKNIIQQPTYATVVIEPNNLLPLLVKPPEIEKNPFETVYLSSNVNEPDAQTTQIYDRLLMPSPRTNSTLSSTEVVKRKSTSNLTRSKTKIISKLQQAPNKTALSRCLKRSDTIETIDQQEVVEALQSFPMRLSQDRSDSIDTIDQQEVPQEELELKPCTIESFQQKTTELVFEYTPKIIMDLLLDSMKDFPVLWEFDDQQFNEDYYEAVEDICKIINNKWSLKIDNLKMRRSINRILRFYCSLFPLQNVENINEYTCFYDKCATFLPSSVHDIAYARCSHCYKCFTCDFDLKHHLLEEQNRNLFWPYKCVQCKECYTDSDDYEFHKRLKHYEEIFRCQTCSKRFNHRSKYNKHLAEYHLDQSSNPGKYVCNICGKSFLSNQRLRTHRMYHGEKQHKCHLCPKRFFINSLLLRHLKSHRNEFDLMCEVCGKGFLTHTNLRQHMKKHTGAKVTCNICNLKLRKSSLNRHLRTVHVACEGTIETTFRAKNHHYKRLVKTRQNYNTRKKKYKVEKDYKCKVCNIHFDGHKAIVQHNKEFHGDRPKFGCKICTSEFIQRIALRKHYRFKHNLHVYQVYKLVDKNEDLITVLAIKNEELDKLSQAADYTLNPPIKSNNNYNGDNNQNALDDPPVDEISFEDECIHIDIIRDEIMDDTDDIGTSPDHKIIEERYMDDLLKMF